MDYGIVGMRADKVAEWLRRWTANPLGSARVSSNLILVVYFWSTTAEQKTDIYAADRIYIVSLA